jgi:hypothetical protein
MTGQLLVRPSSRKPNSVILNSVFCFPKAPLHPGLIDDQFRENFRTGGLRLDINKSLLKQ